MTDAVRYSNRWIGYVYCVDCEKRLRPKTRPESEFPGSVPHKGKGRCTACYERVRVRTKRVDPIHVLKEEIDFMLSSGDSLDSLHRNPGIAKMAVEFVLKKMGYV